MDPGRVFGYKAGRDVWRSSWLEGFPMDASAQQPLAAAKVLIVEDNQQNLELLEIYMEDLAPEVTTLRAVNGLEALEVVDQHKPDLILLDIMMPKMSGFEVCRHLKSNPETRDIFVVVITALNETGDIERATECGADDYLTKPVDRQALVKLVRTMLEARQTD